MSLKLNDLLGLENLENVKIRFNLPSDRIGFDPVKSYHEGRESILTAHFYNSECKKWFNEGEIVIGVLRLEEPDKWLLFDISKITKDYNLRYSPELDGTATSTTFYEHESLEKYSDLFGRLVLKFHKNFQSPVCHADGLIEALEVSELLADNFDELEKFPGYENVNLSWGELAQVLERKAWRTALQNQKGVYLITDTKTNKRYVGSAYGKDMLLGRWQAYATKGYDESENAEDGGHGGNVRLKALVEEKGLEYIKENFRYSILDVFKASTDNSYIINRESFWKEVLLTRNPDFGYNAN